MNDAIAMLVAAFLVVFGVAWLTTLPVIGLLYILGALG